MSVAVATGGAGGTGVFVAAGTGVLVLVAVVPVGPGSRGAFVLVGTGTVVLAAARTLTLAADMLLVRLGSWVLLNTPAVTLICDPTGVPGLTCNTSGKLSVTPGCRAGPVQVMVPVPPMGGVEQAQPGGTVIPWKVVLGGVVKVSTGVAAGPGPLLVTLITAVTLWPGATGFGTIVTTTTRSATGTGVRVAVFAGAVVLLGTAELTGVADGTCVGVRVGVLVLPGT